MRPYIEENKSRKFPFRVMYYHQKRNVYLVLDCHKTKARAEGQLRRVKREIKNGTFEGKR